MFPVSFGDTIITWHKGDRLLTAGPIKVYSDVRLLVDVASNALTLVSLDTQDAGDFYCQLNTKQSPPRLKHTLEILVPPRVTVREMRKEARKGEDVLLKCDAVGHPKPSVTWHRKGKAIPSTNYQQSFGVLHLKSVEPAMGGSYRCIAKNGVGTPAIADIHLDVLFPPIVSVDQTWNYCGVGSNVETSLTCIVSSDPESEILWMRGSMFLSEDSRHSMTRFGSRYVLTITNVQDEDYGNYTCKAENTIGTHKNYILLSGTPTPPVILSSRISVHRDSYKLSWKVTSYFPIVDHRVDIKLLTLSENSSSWFTYSNLQPNHFSGDSVFFESFALDNLQTSTMYQARVWSRNYKGWSKPSENFTFSTASIDTEPKERASKIGSEFSSPASKNILMNYRHLIVLFLIFMFLL